MVELRHPYCSGNHPAREARAGPYTWDQCRLCWLALNEPGRVLALIEGRPAAEAAAKPAAPVRTRWPWKIWLLSWLRYRKDAGAGDTLARRLWFVGDACKKLYKWLTDEDCGCGDRQRRMNVKYPYRAGRGWWLPF